MHDGGLMQVVQALGNVQQAQQGPGVPVRRLHSWLVAAGRRRRLLRQAAARQQLRKRAAVAILADLGRG